MMEDYVESPVEELIEDTPYDTEVYEGRAYWFVEIFTEDDIWDELIGLPDEARSINWIDSGKYRISIEK